VKPKNKGKQSWLEELTPLLLRHQEDDHQPRAARDRGEQLKHSLSLSFNDETGEKCCPIFES
jgi:hypothetical protein